MTVFRPVILWSLIALYASLAAARGASGYEVAFEVGSVIDPARARTIAYTLYYPEDFEGSTHVLLFSHGGAGSPTGHTRYRHFGERWAAAGYVGLHVNHAESAPGEIFRFDRPLDVSFILDALQSNMLPLPSGFGGTLILDRFGHAGHSYGAYTSMALAGGNYALSPDFRDPRIVAIAPISPQGAGQFGGYDLGPSANTWSDIAIPALNIIGEEEMDTNVFGTIFEEGWRLTPFARYPDVGDKFQIILPGQDHSDVGAEPTEEISFYLGENTRLFFDVYLKGRVSSVCAIGAAPGFAGQSIEGIPDLTLGISSVCPPPVGVPEPAFETGLCVALAALGLIVRRANQRGPN